MLCTTRSQLFVGVLALGVGCFGCLLEPAQLKVCSGLSWSEGHLVLPTSTVIDGSRWSKIVGFANGNLHQQTRSSNLVLTLEDIDTLPSENTSEIPVEPESLGPPPELIPVRRSERPKNAPNRLCLNMEVEDDEVGDLGEPANYRAAMIDPDKVLWQGAMDEEMKSMKVNKVWIVVDRPPNAKVVRSKWLYKKKTDMDGKVHTYKARLVAKGCTQTYGIDYEETFSPVADIRAIRILIAIAAYYDYEIWQMDVKTAFLNGRLDEDIYMEQPEGYVNPKYPNRVCKLQRSIYGLKQASRQWNKRFDEEIKRFGFTQNRDEPCVYRKASGSDVVFLILYVDDILIMGNNIPKLKEVKDYLGKCFSVKDLGEAAYILGIKIYRDRSLRLIGLNQSAYIDKILKKFSMQNSKKGFIPMEVKHDLSNEMCASSDEEKAYMKKVPYASAVGSIMYAVRCTRPDVAFAQNLVSRYQQNPGKLHWVAVKHILKYLRNTKDMFLVYGGNPDTELEVTGFCDASWQCDKDDTKSQTGYVFVVNGGAVDWKSKKQTTIAMSATQAEYMAASEAAMEAVWIRKFVGDLGVMPSIKKPINMYCDNSAAIIFANDSGVMKGARHFLRRYHYVREQVESGEIKILKVHTDDNLADPFTKALPRGKPQVEQSQYNGAGYYGYGQGYETYGYAPVAQDPAMYYGGYPGYGGYPQVQPQPQPQPQPQKHQILLMIPGYSSELMDA
ncbi:retrotransposon protein, putative, ty1-copia subclass [Tanacetum coccineum]